MEMKNKKTAFRAQMGFILLMLAGVGVFLLQTNGAAMKKSMPSAPPALTSKGLVKTKTAPASPEKTELATFAAGCFWGVEEEFRKTPGVVGTAVGYSGGAVEKPSYEQVCGGKTGHAESVEVEYDPKRVSYGDLLNLFWALHDPTTLNRQGPDQGEQYRSVIFYHSPEQRETAERSLKRLQDSGDLGGGKIVTQVVKAAPFWKAEDYHQQYVEKGGRASCHFRTKRPSLGANR